MKIQYILLFFCTTLFFACNDSSSMSDEQEKAAISLADEQAQIEQEKKSAPKDNMEPLPNQHTTWQAYKDDFIQSLKNGNTDRLTELTFFPLKGAIPWQKDTKGLLKEDFVSNWDKIFPPEVVSFLENAKEEDWIEAKIETQEQATIRNSPIGTTVHAITKNYVLQSGKGSSTKSTVTFYFAKWGNNFWLTSMFIAG